MKIDKKLLEQMQSAYKSVKEAVDISEVDIEEKMSEVDIKKFKDEIDYDKIPTNVQNLLKFPYIPNINVIDNIKYDETSKQLMIKFKLTYKKLSELFFLRANTDRLIGKMSSSDHDRLLTIGFENMRLVLIFQFKDGIDLNGDTEIQPEIETSENETKPEIEEIKESVEETEFDQNFSVACSAFKQSMNAIKNAIGLTFSEITNEDEMGCLKKIWTETQKEISEMLK